VCLVFVCVNCFRRCQSRRLLSVAVLATAAAAARVAATVAAAAAFVASDKFIACRCVARFSVRAGLGGSIRALSIAACGLRLHGRDGYVLSGRACAQVALCAHVPCGRLVRVSSRQLEVQYVVVLVPGLGFGRESIGGKVFSSVYGVCSRIARWHTLNLN